MLESALALTALFTDLSVTHMPEFRSLVMNRDTLALPPRLLTQVGSTKQTGGRLYRFMANDSDYYLDHRGQAARERVERFQPLLNVRDGVAVWDGYEEGLLPTRAYANFARLFNRNLRNDRPDAPLLAMMQCTAMLTEYPIGDPGPNWRVAATSPGGAAGQYRLWKTDYPAASGHRPAGCARDRPDR